MIVISNFDLSKHSNFLSSANSANLPTAWAGHIPFAYFIVSLLKPKILVELGVYAGGFYNAFCQAVKELGLDAECYGVDTWQGDNHTGYYGEEVYEQVARYHREHYSSFSTVLKETFAEALEGFLDQSIDLLHIDGCHTYEAVKHDFETWLPKMKKDGVVIFHDISKRSGDFGVWQLWEELRANYPTIEMAHSHGLGALFLGYRNAEVEQFVRQFKEEAFIKLLFERIGTAIAENRELSEQKKHLDEAVHKYILEVDQKNQEFIARALELDQRNREYITQALELDRRNREYIAQGRELDQKSQELISQSRELELKNQELIARDREFDRISEEFSEQGGELELMSQELYAHARELEQLSRLFNEVINSGSWKITAPLRTIGQWARKVVKYLIFLNYTLLIQPYRCIVNTFRSAKRDVVKCLVYLKHTLIIQPHKYILNALRSAKRDKDKSYTLDMVIEEYFNNMFGVEIGGPSDFFEKNGYLPLYDRINALDGVNYSSNTVWTGEIDTEEGYKAEGRLVGKQYISDAVDLSPIKKIKYDFVLSCFMIEHIANPIKAIKQWLSVLKTGGVILIVAPRKETNFDHKREVVEFAHLMDDYRNKTGEDDLSHLDEIMELHDLEQDPLAGGREQFYERCLKNYENRCLHQHVYDMNVLEEIYGYFNLTILQKIHFEYGFIIIGRKENMIHNSYAKICNVYSGAKSSISAITKNAG